MDIDLFSCKCFYVSKNGMNANEEGTSCKNVSYVYFAFPAT